MNAAKPQDQPAASPAAPSPTLGEFVKVDTRSTVYALFGIRIEAGGTFEEVLVSLRKAEPAQDDPHANAWRFAIRFAEAFAEAMAKPDADGNGPLLAAAIGAFGRSSLDSIEAVLLDVSAKDIARSLAGDTRINRVSSVLMGAARMLQPIKGAVR